MEVVTPLGTDRLLRDGASPLAVHTEVIPSSSLYTGAGCMELRVCACVYVCACITQVPACIHMLACLYMC